MPARDQLSLTGALRAARDTRILEIGHGVLQKTLEVFRREFGESEALVVADVNTLAAAGGRVLYAFSQAGHSCREPFIFSDPGLYAEYRYVAELEELLKRHQVIPVAVGAGTINDLTKLAAHRAGRPYVCVATAASMDGYTAFGASITHQGSKQTFLCPAPRAVVADLDVICAAPGAMNSWGYADLLAKITAGADWMLADALGVEPIDPQAWRIVQGGLCELVSDPAGVRSCNPKAIARLVEGLMLSGFAMQWAKSSRPASGAEHQFSHLWDMQHQAHNGRAPSHGFQVGIGSLSVTALYECLLALPLEELDVDACCAQWQDEGVAEKRIRILLDEAELVSIALQESRAKAVTAAKFRMQLERLRQIWPDLRDRLLGQLLPLAELKARLRDAGAPVDPEQIGISRHQLRGSFWQAYFIRRRFTVLDLSVRTGLLEGSLDHIFGPQGPWPIKSKRAGRKLAPPP
jgi:glycerol-1-phosphate dehydrogenase [NAD(P)+]